MAFADVFLLLGLLFLVFAPLVWFMRRPPPVTGCCARRRALIAHCRVMTSMQLGWLAVAARSRRLDDDGFAGVDGRGVAAGELFNAAVLPPHRIFADLTVAAAGKPERRHAAVAGQDGAFHFFQKADGADDAVAGVPLAAAAGAFADVEILEQDRIAEFQNFRIGQPRVGHVGVHGVGAGKAGTRRRAGADRLVILVARIAEIEIVHGALRRRHRAERTEQAIGHLLRGLDIAGDHRGGKFRRQQRFFRNDDADRAQAAGIHRNVVIDHDAENVEHRGAGHRLGRVEVVGLLRAGAGEIDGRFAALLVDADAHLDDGALVHLDRKRAVMQPVDDAAHAFRGIVLDVVHVGLAPPAR